MLPIWRKGGYSRNSYLCHVKMFKAMEDLIREQLDRAEEACSVTPEVMKMDGCRLTSQSEVAEEVFLFKLFDTPCFPRGDLTTITGPAKSGKTFLVSMLMACCVKRQVLAFERVREEPLKVVWLDTEQSRMTTKRILTERVGKMVLTTDYADYTDNSICRFHNRCFF